MCAQQRVSSPVNVLLKKFERYKLQLFSFAIVKPCCFFLPENSSKQKGYDRKFLSPWRTMIFSFSIATT